MFSFDYIVFWLHYWRVRSIVIERKKLRRKEREVRWYRKVKNGQKKKIVDAPWMWCIVSMVSELRKLFSYQDSIPLTFPPTSKFKISCALKGNKKVKNLSSIQKLGVRNQVIFLLENFDFDSKQLDTFTACYIGKFILISCTFSTIL